jgi:hypothetical protein
MIVAAAAVLRGGSSPDERTRRLWFGGVIARSAFPVVALAAVILSLAALPLRAMETRQVARAVEAQKSALFLNEAQAPEYIALRERLAQEREALLREGDSVPRK